MFSFSSDKYSDVQFLDHMVDYHMILSGIHICHSIYPCLNYLLLHFWGMSILFSIMAPQIYIPISSAPRYEIEQTSGDGRDREAWHAAVRGVVKSWTSMASKQLQCTRVLHIIANMLFVVFLLIAIVTDVRKYLIVVSTCISVMSYIEHFFMYLLAIRMSFF